MKTNHFLVMGVKEAFGASPGELAQSTILRKTNEAGILFLREAMPTAILDCGGKRSATPLSHAPPARKRRRRSALPAQSKMSPEPRAKPGISARSWTAATPCRFHHETRNSTRRGIMLIECMVYIGLFFLVVGIAFKLFYVCWDSTKAFRRATDQIANAVRTGDHWREEVRSATAPLRAEDSPDGPVLHIPRGPVEIDYRFSDGALWRRASAQAEWLQVLSDIKSSRMASDPRPQLTAWRWELELASHRKGARVVPLFTFEAVPKTPATP